MPRSIFGTRRTGRGAVSRRAVLASLVALLGLLTTSSLRAAPPETTAGASFRETYERAGRLYAAKDYTAAIPVLHAAYAIQPVPQLLFNIAQAYRRLEQWSSSRVYFEMYRMLLTSPTPEVLGSLDRVLVEVKEKEQAEKQPQVIEKTRTLVVQTEKPVPRYLRPLGITSSLLGLGLIAGGATFLGLNGQCASPAVAPAVACDQLYSTGTPGIALTAAGAGVFLLGVVTFSLSLRKPQRVAPRIEEDFPSLPGLFASEPEPPPSGWNRDGTRQEPEPPPQGWNPDGTPASRK